MLSDLVQTLQVNSALAQGCEIPAVLVLLCRGRGCVTVALGGCRSLRRGHCLLRIK